MMPADPGRARDGRADAGGAIVAFDFDGTLTTRDSFVAFLRWRAGPAAWARGLLRLAPSLLAYVFHRDRCRLKSAAVRVFLSGVTRAQLDADARAFAAAAYSCLIRPDALAAWAAHQAEDARMVIVTASPEETVTPFAERLGAFALIGSRLAWSGEGRVGDGLDGPNCRGAEKVVRLRERFGPQVRLAAAYGDTSGDVEMLGLADRGEMRRFTARP